MWIMKFRLLLLDANVVIYLYELGIWDSFISQCQVTLTQTVVDESDYWIDESGVRHAIDLQADIQKGKINCIEVSLEILNDFLKKYGPVYLERMDPGEAESLAFLFHNEDEWLFTSGDEIVFKVLGAEGRFEQGISLEEILQKIGLSRSGLRVQFTKQFRLNVTKKGQFDGITGFEGGK